MARSKPTFPPRTVGGLKCGGRRSPLWVFLRTSVLVKKILFSPSNSSDPVASGVLYTTAAGEGQQVAARKEVILSAGAINSPRMLESSGVGDAALLKSLVFPVVDDNTYVGENLQYHLDVALAFQSVAGDGLQTIDELSRQDPAALAAAMEAYGHQSGPLAKSNGNEWRTCPSPTSPLMRASRSGATKTNAAFDQALKSYVQSILQSATEASAFYITVPGWASYTPDGNTAAIPAGNETYFSIPVLLAHPLSRGSVHITSSNISASKSGLTVNPNYLAHVEILARYVQFVEASLATTAPLLDALIQSAGAKRAPGMPAGPQGFCGRQSLGAGTRLYV